MNRGTLVDYTGSFLHSVVLDKFLSIGEARIRTIVITDDKVTEVHLEDEEDFVFSFQGFCWVFHGDNGLLYDKYKIPIKPINNDISIKYRRKHNQSHTVSNRNTTETLNNLIQTVLGMELLSEEYEDGRDCESTYGLC